MIITSPTFYTHNLFYFFEWARYLYLKSIAVFAEQKKIQTTDGRLLLKT